MPRHVDAPPLMRCGALPCPWVENFRRPRKAELHACPHRIQTEDSQEKLRYALCAFFSLPGPHAPSKIAKACGLSVDTVNDRLQSAEEKLRDLVMRDPFLAGRPEVAAMLCGGDA